MLESNSTKTIRERVPSHVVSQFHHRLLALEITLKDDARSGSMNDKDFSRRIQRLRIVQNQLRELLDSSEKKSNANGYSTDLGLPAMSACGPEELRICDAYLQQRQKELHGIDRILTRVAQWTEDAATGRSGFFRIINRLSKLRKFVGKIDASSSQVEQESQWLQTHSEHFLDSMGLRSDHQAPTTIRSLVRIFEEMDQTISRVARLRAKARKVKNEVRTKEAWLEQQERSLVYYRPQFAAPEPGVVWQYMRKNPADSALVAIKDRTNRVQKFWDNVLIENGTGKPIRHRSSLTTHVRRHK